MHNDDDNRSRLAGDEHSPGNAAQSTLPPATGGTFAAIGRGWRQMKSHFLMFLLAVFVSGIAQMPLNLHGSHYDGEVSITEDVQVEPETENGQVNRREVTVQQPDFSGSAGLVGLIALAYSVLLYPVFKFGVDYIFVKGARSNERIEPDTLLAGFGCYLNVILANLLVWGIVLIGFIMLIIPGIYLLCRLCFVSYLVMDEGMDPIQSVEASWRLTRGRVLGILGLAIMSCFIFIGGLLLLIVGVFPAIMWIKAAFASLYLSSAARQQ